MTALRDNRPGLAIIFIVLTMTCISINDMLIKLLSDDYPLHQMVFLRSAIGIVFSLVILQFEGGFRLLRTNQIWLHLLRGLCIVGANMAFFAAIAVIPLADAMALFFVAPLFITILAVPFLGERVGARLRLMRTSVTLTLSCSKLSSVVTLMFQEHVLFVRSWQCAPTARITSGGRIHPDRCR